MGKAFSLGNYSKATAIVIGLSNRLHTQEYTAVITSQTKAATETQNGETVYTATVTVDGKTYKIEKRVTIPAQGQSNAPSNTPFGCLSTINSDGMMIGLTLMALTIASMMRGKRKES